MKGFGNVLLALAVLFLPCGAAPAAPAAADVPTLLYEVSYYPREYPWEAFWPHWPDVRPQVDEDLDLIAGLGANTVRIFLHPDASGYPTPTVQFLGSLADALDLIDQHGLKAHVNLFDCWESWSDIEGSKAWLAGVVSPHQDDTRIALWELRNEVGLRDAFGAPNPLVRAWVQALFPYLKQQAGSTPCTVSVGEVEWLADLRDLLGTTPPDIYSLHWYPHDVSWTSGFPAVIDRARELTGQDRLLVGEFGASVCPFSEAGQANLYRDVLYYAQQKGLTDLGAWTLYDFPSGTLECDGTVLTAGGRTFGLYRSDGSPRPAAAILRSAFLGSPPSGLSPALIVNPSFDSYTSGCPLIDNWGWWDEDWTGQSTAVQDCSMAHSGSCSAQVHRPYAKPIGLYTVPALSVEPGRRYSLEGYVQTENLAGWARLTLSWFDANGGWLGQTESPATTEANLRQWTRLHIDGAQAPPEAAYVQAFVQVYSSAENSYVWFDDVTTLVRHTYLPLILKGP